MSVVIDLSDFQGMDIESTFKSSDVEINRESSTVLSIDSKTAVSSYLKFHIPGPLAVGAKVTLVCETENVSGDLIQLSIDSYSAADYTSDKVLETNIDGEGESELLESRVNMYVRPGNQYARAVVGFFGSRIGVAKIRSMRVLIDGSDISTVKPHQTTPPNYSRVWSMEEINREWSQVVDGTGNVTRSVSEVSMTANIASRAYIRYAATNGVGDKKLNALMGVEDSKGFTVSVKAVRNSGLPGVFVNYFNSSDVEIQTIHGFFLGNDDEWSTFWFPPVPDSEYAEIAMGFFTSNDGDWDVKGVKVQQYGAALPCQHGAIKPILAVMKKVAGSWVIDNDSVGDAGQRFASCVIETVTPEPSGSEDRLTLTFALNSYRGYRPSLIAQVDAFNNFAASYFATTSFVNNTSAQVQIYDHATRTKQNPTTLPDGVVIQLVGFGIG